MPQRSRAAGLLPIFFRSFAANVHHSTASWRGTAPEVGIEEFRICISINSRLALSRSTARPDDKQSSTSPKSPGWLSLRTMEDEINHLLARTDNKFCTPNGSRCNGNTIGLLVRRHITAGEFHYVGKEASTRWASGPDLSMMAEAGALDQMDETFREYERVVDPEYLEQIRVEAKEFSTKRLSRQSALAECAIRSFKRGKNTNRPRSLRKLIRAIHGLQNKDMKS
jgi:hypothetical protein